MDTLSSYCARQAPRGGRPFSITGMATVGSDPARGARKMMERGSEILLSLPTFISCRTPKGSARRSSPSRRFAFYPTTNCISRLHNAHHAHNALHNALHRPLSGSRTA